MIWGLIVQGLAIVQAMMRNIVSVTYHFDISDDLLAGGNGQWNGTLTADLTDKGNDIVASLLTIIHYGLNFLAQFTLLLPAIESSTYISDTGQNMLTLP